MFSRIPRFSRFNARAWKYQHLFETPRARRLTAAATLTFIALVGTAIFWSPNPASDPRKRAVAWKTFTPPRDAAAKPAAEQAVRADVRDTASLLTPIVIKTAKPAAPRAVSKQAPTAKPAPKRAPADPLGTLGTLFVDAERGFSIRLPARWAIRTSAGKPWLLDCGRVGDGLISVALLSRPAGSNAGVVTTDWVSRHVENRDGASPQAQGSAMIGGRKAFWSKSTTGSPTSGAAGRTTRISYILPLSDGRLAEIRVAASADSFESVAAVMKQAVATFRPLSSTAGRDAVAKAE